ncbi:Maf family protein [Thiohalobacter thiocyanaticus]|uniref:dTTP/UTP pyrophosphatase n=1 Tax=Thiohalobacter thiocyanaticus TaxID=585455 RepID=A0A426QHL5_9GAMM|nr:Maf family protein [Thiohalobacter thiocyanaticus]RRQ21255.1 septum formation inhibitor Maf [Thiohalobacter thiocyanaticus]
MILLASASPRRRELLDQLGVAHRAEAVDIDETPRRDEPVADLVCRLALTKARTLAARSGVELPVLGADTLISLDGVALGKPAGREDGLAMLARLSGREHEVLSAVALVTGAGGSVRLNRSRVRFRALTRAECEAYWATGEPADKAGAYAIQGRAAMFISHLEGSYTGVMGLPLYETAELLRESDIGIT